MQKALMKGFPPPTELQVTLANWRRPPFNKWSFQHVREIIPTADIPNDPDNVRKLSSAPLGTFDGSLDQGQTAVFTVSKRSCARPIPMRS